MTARTFAQFRLLIAKDSGGDMLRTLAYGVLGTIAMHLLSFPVRATLPIYCIGLSSAWMACCTICRDSEPGQREYLAVLPMHWLTAAVTKFLLWLTFMSGLVCLSLVLGATGADVWVIETVARALPETGSWAEILRQEAGNIPRAGYRLFSLGQIVALTIAGSSFGAVALAVVAYTTCVKAMPKVSLWYSYPILIGIGFALVVALGGARLTSHVAVGLLVGIVLLLNAAGVLLLATVFYRRIP